MALPRFPFVVIDMNTCRRDEEVVPLLANWERERVGIVLPSVAHWELTKGKTTGTIHSSFRLLAQRPEAVSFARHPYSLKGQEHFTKRPLRLATIVDHRHTQNIREVLRGLRDDTHVVDPETVLAKHAHWRALLDHENEPKILRQLIGVHRSVLPRPRASAIRSALQAGNTSPFNAYLAEAVGGRAPLAMFLRGVGYGSSMSKRILRFPSVSILHYLALLAVALRWRVLGGGEGAKDDTLERAMIDAEYATIASLGRGYVTRDDGAREVYEAVVSVANRLWR